MKRLATATRAFMGAALTALLVAACATSPTGRPQLKLFSESDLAQMGVASYQKIKEATPQADRAGVRGYVQCVADSITDVVGGNWEVTVFAQDQVNAFALPGGKIGVYTGLLEVAQGPAQLAAVIGHEVAHVLADHANARVSSQFVTQTALQLASAILGTGGAGGQLAMAALGLGAQVGVLLPYARGQESEADVIGLKLMAQAGFDPRAAVALWQNMAKAAEGQPPEFLSTHPSHGSRIAELQSHMQQVLPIYRAARAQGRTPDCR